MKSHESDSAHEAGSESEVDDPSSSRHNAKG